MNQNVGQRFRIAVTQPYLLLDKSLHMTNKLAPVNFVNKCMDSIELVEKAVGKSGGCRPYKGISLGGCSYINREVGCSGNKCKSTEVDDLLS